MASAAESEDDNGVVESMEEDEVESDIKFAYQILPKHAWKNALSQLKYEKIWELRLGCKSFYQLGSELLGEGALLVESKLEERWLTGKHAAIHAYGNHNFKGYIKFVFLDYVMNFIDKLFMLFHEFIGRNGGECFTPGKRIDLLSTFFMVMDDSELWCRGEVDFRCVLTPYRESYDRNQMKFLEEFDYCLYVWLRVGQDVISMNLDAAPRVYNLCRFIRHFKAKAEQLKRSSEDHIFAVTIWYIRDFYPSEDDMETEPIDVFKYFLGEDQADDYGSYDLFSKVENWTPLVDRPDDAQILLFQKYLFDLENIGFM